MNVTSSPPLIVAFLGIAVILAAILTIFGWRRMVIRGVALQPIGEDGSFTQRNVGNLEERPELWDFWTLPSPGSDEKLKWERIMPLSASIERPVEEPSDHSRPQGTDIYTYPQFQTIRQHICRHAAKADDRKTDPESGENQTLQVAVAIAMPSPHKCEREILDDGSTSPYTQIHEPHHDVEPLQYSLGLKKIPWHSEEA